MQIKTILKALSYKIKNKESKWVSKRLCGIPLQVVEGTIREKTDQDDTWWFYLAKHHTCIFDIGCNIGYTAIISQIQHPNRQMLLVDPNPKALQLAANNLIANGLGNRVQYMSAFVGNTVDETVKFYTLGSGAAGSMYASHAQTASSLNAHMDAKTVTLDYLYDYYKIAPDLVKIDVEGAETLVIEACKKLAKETQCTFFIEMHNVEGLGMEVAGQYMLDWCNEMDYKAWYLKEGIELIDAGTIKGRGKCHLLLLPNDKPYPDYLMGIPQYAPLPNTV